MTDSLRVIITAVSITAIIMTNDALFVIIQSSDMYWDKLFMLCKLCCNLLYMKEMEHVTHLPVYPTNVVTPGWSHIFAQPLHAMLSELYIDMPAANMY